MRMRISRLLLLLTLLLGAPLALADPLQHEFLLLPSAQVAGTWDRSAPVTNVVDEVLQADMIFSLQKGAFKVFGEYLLSDHEGDLERFQLGWQASSNTVIWFGRFHQPSSVWNHDHHHGQYLSTSITRPQIDDWEDLGGVLPQHFTGGLLESSRALSRGWQLRAAFGAGLAPQITPQGLVPFDLVHPDSNRRQAGYQARFSLHPGDLTETGFGLLLANDDLAAVGFTAPQFVGLDRVTLQLIGAFANYSEEPWKLQLTVYHAEAEQYFTGASVDDHFTVGWLQVERRLPHELTAFARWEDAANADRSVYLKMFPGFAKSRLLGGLRWDFARRQALTLQVTHTHTLPGEFSDIRFQWSAAFF
jgi:hypothetical protein